MMLVLFDGVMNRFDGLFVLRGEYICVDLSDCSGQFCEYFFSSFCIIEGPETVQDFAPMQLQEIQENIRSRRNKIFLHMEEANLQSLVFLSYFLSSSLLSYLWVGA